MDAFHTAMSDANVEALWERENSHRDAVERPHAWPWRTMSPLLDEAVRATSMGNAERRVLVMRNPALADIRAYAANWNLAVNLQVLMPGESARPHRHSMHALRFVLEGEGVSTVVEGKDCPMLPGDMVLTPAWTWHEHVHRGSSRCVWVDALDVPVHEFMGTAVFEPGPARDVQPLPPDSAFASPGLAPLGPEVPYSPMFRYPWSAAVQALDAMPASADGSRTLRYTNPVTGGAVLSSIDCFVTRLAAGATTRPARSNGHVVCVVVEGEGESRADDAVVKWTKNDVFALPSKQWITHKARGGAATLFVISDRELLQRLGYLREESAA